jgi:hypothetical protein
MRGTAVSCEQQVCHVCSRCSVQQLPHGIQYCHGTTLSSVQALQATQQGLSL